MKAVKDGKTGSQAAESPQDAEEGQIPEKWLFPLPYISHNVHYTKFIQSENKTALLFWFCVRRSYRSLYRCCTIQIQILLFWVMRCECIQFKVNPARCSSCGCVPKYAQMAS